MSGDGVVPVDLPTDSGGVDERPNRLHYLDWLRVLLILGVFLYHALHPFDSTIEWHIKNDEQSKPERRELMWSVSIPVRRW